MRLYTAETVGDFEINLLRVQYVNSGWDEIILAICDAAQAPGEYYDNNGHTLKSPLDGNPTTRREMRQLIANKLNEIMGDQ